MTCKDCIHCIAQDRRSENVYCTETEGWAKNLDKATSCREYRPAYRKEEKEK